MGNEVSVPEPVSSNEVSPGPANGGAPKSRSNERGPYWSRLRDDDVQVQRYVEQSEAPFNYVVSFRAPDACDPGNELFQCAPFRPGADRIDVNNALRFGEEFTTYEPGHAVNTELVGRSPFIARGEGILQNIDVDTSMRPEPSYADAVRSRKHVEELDLTSRVLPPVDAYSTNCANPFEIRVDDGTDIPRGGASTRVSLRNAEKYASR